MAPVETPSSAPGYAISVYPDVPAVSRRLQELVRQPLRPIKRDAMAGYLEYFASQCRRSKELTDEASELIPGGVQHNLAFNYPFPLAIERAEGAHLWDVDGNECIDFLQAGGPTVLGSNYAPLREKVAEVVAVSGPVTGLFHEYELKLAQLVNRLMPSCEMFRMLGSGTESVMAAIRAVRVHTGKKWVLKVGGAYRRWSDQMVYGLHVPGTRRFESKGIPFGATARTREVFPDDLSALRRKLQQNRLLGGTAAVIVEPIGPESGTRPVPFDFNAKVRDLCDIIRRYRLPFVAYNQGSIVHLETAGVMLLELKPRKHMMEEMGAAYTANGLITLAGSRMYTSMADTDAVIDDALGRFERVLSSVRGA
jgi:hypothetical protein